MKTLAEPITVANLTRVACTRFEIVSDNVTNDPAFVRVGVQFRPFNASCGTVEADQFANSYQPYVLRITNTVCSRVTARTELHNQYSNRFVKDTFTSTGLMDAVIAARAAAAQAQKDNATLVALAAAGAIPALAT